MRRNMTVKNGSRRKQTYPPATKVAKFAVVRRRDDDIGRFHVQVHQMLPMDEGQCLGDVQRIPGQ